MESVWYGVAKVSKSPLQAGGCTALTKKKNTTKTFYFLLQRNVTSKTNALLHQPGAFLSGSFLFFFRHVGPDTCLELHILQTSVNIRPVSEVTPQNSGKEKKKHPSSETMTMTFTQGWMEASPRPPTDRQTDRQDRQTVEQHSRKTFQLQAGSDRIVTSTSSSRMSVSVFSSSHMLGLVRPKSPWTNSLM